MNYRRAETKRGFSFVELIITAAVMLLVFGGLAATFKSMIVLVGNSKVKAGAVSIANERMEYLRSLSYDALGTVGGIPNGLIPQNATSTLNGIEYAERTIIQYIDAPEDGEGAADSNGILSDYKQAKVEISWDRRGVTKSIFLVTNIVPKGMETTAGGGTLTVKVFDAASASIQAANVHVYNDTISPTIDITKNTNPDGVAIFAGAPAGSNYQIDVTKNTYSTDQTYSASTTNPNPITPHVSVIESEVSTMNFQIDELSDLNIKTVAPATVGEFKDEFSDSTLIASSTNTSLSGGALTLSGSAGSYPLSGFVWSSSTTPSTIISWEAVVVSGGLPTGTDIKVQVHSVTGTSTYSLVPDTELPGNSGGFSLGTIDISSIDVSTYPTLAIGAKLETADVNETPEILEWMLSYIISESSIGNVSLLLTGNKTIGSLADLSPVYKYQKTHTTNASGEVDVSDLEWDSYDVELNGGAYDIAEACENIPYALNPGVSEDLKLTLVPNDTNTLRVMVKNSSGDPIPGASVTLSRPGFSDSNQTSVCGQYFFTGGLSSAADYQIDITASGYVTEAVSDVEISEDVVIVIELGT